MYISRRVGPEALSQAGYEQNNTAAQAVVECESRISGVDLNRRRTRRSFSGQPLHGRLFAGAAPLQEGPY
jgi:hypothetical protein